MRYLTRALSLAGLLLVLWLVLNDSLSLGQWLIGGIIALTLALLAPLLRPVQARPRHPLTALRLVGHVARDVAVSSAVVAWRIVRGDAALAQPGFLDIPLRLHDPHGLAALACIVTFTPGTVWSGHDVGRNVLTLHVLDLNRASGLVHTIQERYERPLMEIFE